MLRPSRLYRLLVGLALVGVRSVGTAQAPSAGLDVRLLDAETGDPIVGAHVTFPELFLFWVTDAEGRTAVRGIPTGPHRVEFSADQYASTGLSVELIPGLPARAEIQLLREGRSIEITTRSVSGSGPASLRLRVIDASTGRPVQSASVIFRDIERFWLTDENGYAVADPIPPGRRDFEVALIGYGTVRGQLSFAPGAVAEAEVRLAAQPISIEGVAVTVRTSTLSERLAYTGFYERARIGVGSHLDRFQIGELNPTRSSDIFRALPGVRLVPNSHGDYEVWSGRGCGLGGGGAMRIYLDGVPWSGVVDDLPVEWLEAAEVYVSLAQVPVQYSIDTPAAGEGGCGAILLWTP